MNMRGIYIGKRIESQYGGDGLFFQNKNTRIRVMRRMIHFIQAQRAARIISEKEKFPEVRRRMWQVFSMRAKAQAIKGR